MVEGQTEAVPVITVDGPSGSGKGTVSRRVARRLGWHFLDSGALYRLVGLAAGRRGVALDDADGLARLAAGLDFEFRLGTGVDEEQVLLEGDPVGAALRTETCGEAASQVAALIPVRQALLICQREFRRPPGLVADGRDMGTVVFPSATVKIYLEASPQERASRRYKQLKDKGMDVSLAALLEDIEARDRRDTQREVSPLQPAHDAVVIDTTEMSVDQVVAAVLHVWQVSLGAG